MPVDTGKVQDRRKVSYASLMTYWPMPSALTTAPSKRWVTGRPVRSICTWPG